MLSGFIARTRAAQLVAAATLTLGASALLAQAPAPRSQVPIKAATQTYGGPGVGDMAPDFSLPGATRYGELKAPVKLSDFRGQTVVLAFFPGARTPGCTIQMTKYRDMYQSLFKGGDSVVVLGVSVDPDSTLADWARKAHFPMVFASDAGTHAAGEAYGAYNPTYKLNMRLLYVIGPDGRITYVAKPFNVSKMESYAALGDAVAKTAGR
jgi:peroxiredoxin Q/BCP